MLFFSLSLFQLGERMVVLKPCRFFMVTSRFWRTLEVNNFVSVDFQTQVSIWFLISMKFCTRIINKKRGVRKCNSAFLTMIHKCFAVVEIFCNLIYGNYGTWTWTRRLPIRLGLLVNFMMYWIWTWKMLRLLYWTQIYFIYWSWPLKILGPPYWIWTNFMTIGLGVEKC